MVPVGIEQAEGEAVRHAGLGPGLGIRLVAAHHEAADLLLEVDQAVRIAQRRQVGGHALDRLGDQVLMLHGLQRHAHPGKSADRLGPLPGAQRHHVAGDLAPSGAHARHPALLDAKAGDGAVLDDAHAVLPCAAGERLGDVGRVRLAVGRQESGADQVGRVHQRPQILGLGGREQMHLEAEAARGGGLAPELDHAVGIAGKAQAAVALPARRLAGLGLEPLVQLDRVLEQPGDVGVAAQLADEPGGMPGRARGQLVALEQHDVAPAGAGEVVGDRAADDAAADDDAAGDGWGWRSRP